MKILIAADGSAYTQRVLDFLVAHEEWLAPHHRYTVLHVVPAVPARAASMLDKETLKSYYEEEADKVLKPIQAFFDQHGLPCELLFKTGHASEHIGALADKGGFDLVVMGSHGHTGIGSLILGSVVGRVMSHGNVPVLIVR